MKADSHYLPPSSVFAPSGFPVVRIPSPWRRCVFFNSICSYVKVNHSTYEEKWSMIFFKMQKTIYQNANSKILFCIFPTLFSRSSSSPLAPSIRGLSSSSASPGVPTTRRRLWSFFSATPVPPGVLGRRRKKMICSVKHVAIESVVKVHDQQ